MSRPNIKHGVTVGTGSAINIALGWVPDSVEVYNASDGDLITTGYLIPYVISFTGGGTVEIVAGAALRGVTSLATARVAQVFLVSGTWAAGTAAGFLTLEEDSYVGTITSGGEDIVVTNLASGAITTAAGGDATIPATAVTAPPAGLISDSNVAVATAATIANGVTGIARYAGVAGSTAKGFTIGSTVSESGKLLRYRAFRGDVV